MWKCRAKMFNFAVPKLLLAAIFFAAVTANVIQSNLEDLNYEFPDSKEVVFGAKGDSKVYLSEISCDYPKVQSQISSKYTHTTFDKKITMIVVYSENIVKGSSYEVFIREGGLGENYVTLEVLAENTESLIYSVTIYGVDSE